MTSSHNKTRGFTLIELLVVISIIGLLSSIVLAAVNSARLKALDQRLISDMVSLRTASQISFTMLGQYSLSPVSTCGYPLTFYGATFGTATYGGGQKIMTDLGSLSNNNRSCHVAQNSYVVFAALPSTLNTTLEYVCADSSGKIKRGVASTAENVGYSGDGVDTPFVCL